MLKNSMVNDLTSATAFGGGIAKGVVDNLAEYPHEFVGLLHHWREVGG